MYGKFFKRILVVLGLFIGTMFSFGGPAEAADVYSIVYNDVSAHNGDADQSAWITQAILYSSNYYGVDPFLVTAVMETESGFYMNAVSPAGAVGLMQLMPSTAAAIGVNPWDPLGNITGGTAHLRTLLNTFAGAGEYAVTDAVAAYNAGAGAVESYGGCPPYGETRAYVRKVSNNYNNLMAQYY